MRIKAHVRFLKRGTEMEKMTAGILTGGKSSRMGEDKAALLYRNQTFLAHLEKELSQFDELLISVPPSGEAGMDDGQFPLVRDELADFGPVEGIYQLLRRSRNPYVLVVATDMQRLNAAFFADFVGQLQPEDRCLVPCDGKLLEPLCSVYHKDALPFLEQMRREGIRRPRALFSRLPTHYVELSKLGYDRRIMDNINTRAEYAALLEDV